MSNNHQNNQSQTCSWFTTPIEYQGQGSAQFLNIPGAIEGSVVIRYNESGQSSVEMNVDQREMLELLGEKRTCGIHLSFGGNPIPCTKLVVTTTQGEFTASGNFHYGFTLRVGGAEGESAQLTFSPLRGQFTAKGAGPARYWVMPLTNFTSRFIQQHPTLDEHPLRLFTASDQEDLDELNDYNREYRISALNRLIIFLFEDNPAFIEPLPDYEDRELNLLEGRERHLITAIMVGELGAHSTDETSLDEWFPTDFLRLLGFATGTRVGSPWMEFRDEHGALVSRLHVKLDAEPFSKGRRIMEEGVHSGIGYLLSCYQSAPDRGKSYLGVTLKHINRAASQGQSIEDHTVYLSRALDTLCQHYGFKTQYLRYELEEEQQQLVTKHLEDAARHIRLEARSSFRKGHLDQSRIIEKIADRVRNAANKDVDFGLAVVALLKHFNLTDADIIDAYYQDHPHPYNFQTWSSVISHYRGTAMHRGYYDISGNGHNFEDVLRINDHLHDILIRIIFKIMGYDGTYQPPVIKQSTSITADWVTPDLSADKLGYV